MAKISVKAGTTSLIVNVFIMDSSSTTGAGKTGLAYNTASLTAYYCLAGAAAVAITLATQTVTGAYSSGGFVEIDATNMPGWYRLDVPNAAIASGRFSSIHLKGASGMAPLPLEIELTAVDNSDAVRFGLTALPNAAAAASGGLWILGSNNTAAITIGALTVGAIAGTTLTLSGAVAFQSTFAITGTTTFTGAISGTNASNDLRINGAVPGAANGLVIAGSNAATTFATLTSTGALTINGVSHVSQTGDSYALANGSSGFAAIYGKVDTEIGSIITTLGTPAGASMSADIAAVKSDSAAILVDTGTTLDARIPAALVGGRMDANIGAISADSVAADNAEAFFDGTGYAGTGNTIPTVTTVGTLTTYTGNTPQTGDTYARMTKPIVTGSITGGASTTTSLNTTGLSPAAAVTDQFKGRIIIFDAATTTANLRGQASDITASTAGGVLTVTALTTAPAAGDTFTIL